MFAAINRLQSAMLPTGRIELIWLDVGLKRRWTLILIKTAALTERVRRPTKPVVFTADGTAMPIVAGQAGRWRPRLSSGDCYGQGLETCQSKAVIHLRWSFSQNFKSATQYTLQGQIKKSLYAHTDAEGRALGGWVGGGARTFAARVSAIRLAWAEINFSDLKKKKKSFLIMLIIKVFSLSTLR